MQTKKTENIDVDEYELNECIESGSPFSPIYPVIYGFLAWVEGRVLDRGRVVMPFSRETQGYE